MLDEAFFKSLFVAVLLDPLTLDFPEFPQFLQCLIRGVGQLRPVRLV